MEYVAIMTCSCPDCAERLEVVGTLEELETLACECGCGLLFAGWPEPVREGSLALAAG